jgi:hypothetical protein
MEDFLKEIKLKYQSKCDLCSKTLPRNTKAIYDTKLKKVRCLTHEEINIKGSAGFSAKEKAFSIEKKRKEDIESIPYIGKIIYPFLNPSKEAARWAKGANGELRTGKVLEDIAIEHNFKLLHDRKIPKSRANIDHILITDKAVFIIDAKNYKGRVEIRNASTFLKKEKDKLFVNGRNRTKIVEGILWQVGKMQEELHRINLEYDVVGILGFVDSRWSFFSKPIKIEGVYLNSKGFIHILNDYQPNIGCDIDKAFFAIDRVFKEK